MRRWDVLKGHNPGTVVLSASRLLPPMFRTAMPDRQMQTRRGESQA